MCFSNRDNCTSLKVNCLVKDFLKKEEEEEEEKPLYFTYTANMNIKWWLI